MRTGTLIQDESQPRELSSQQLADRLAFYRFTELRTGTVVIGDLEQIDRSRKTLQRFNEIFSELGLLVVTPELPVAGQPRQQLIGSLTRQHDLDLVCILEGDVRQRDEFHGFFSHTAEIRATVYESNGSLVATKELSVVGQRSTDRAASKESAFAKAADEIAPFMLEQLSRKIDRNVVTRRLGIRGLVRDTDPMDIRTHLQQQAGVNDVRLISWAASEGIATYVVSVEPWVTDRLGSYLLQIPNLDLRILSEDRRNLEVERTRKMP